MAFVIRLRSMISIIREYLDLTMLMRSNLKERNMAIVKSHGIININEKKSRRMNMNLRDNS